MRKQKKQKNSRALIAVLLSLLVLNVTFAAGVHAEEYVTQPSPCPTDLFTKNHVPLNARHQKFFEWMFTDKPPFDRVYKNLSTVTKSPNLSVDGRTGIVSTEPVVNLGYFIAHVYAADSFSDAVDLGVYGTPMSPPSAQQLRFETVSYKKKITAAESLSRFPPEKIREEYKLSASVRNNIFIFVEDEKYTIDKAQMDAAIDRLKKSTIAPLALDQFTPEAHCRIYRQRENFRIIQTYGRITIGASPENAARCAATTAMVNFGLSNVAAVFSDGMLVVRRQESEEKNQGSYKDISEYREDPNDNRYRLNIMPPPYARLYDTLYKNGFAVEAVQPGETLCQASDDFYLTEVSQCSAIKRENSDGSFERKFFPEYVAEQSNRCNQFGINIKHYARIGYRTGNACCNL